MSDEIPAGTILAFSTGEYSDYGYTGHFVTLEAITAEKISDAADDAKAKKGERDALYDEWQASGSGASTYPGYASIHELFISAMIKAGLLASINVRELYLGSYGELQVSL